MRTLIVVDMQNDFITGSLGTAEAVSIVPNVVKKISEYEAAGARIIFTRDTHFDNYLETNEGKHLPVVHCVKDTWGWQVEDTVDRPGMEHVDKITFGYDGWGSYQFDEVEICGLCTDICVISNALILKALNPEMEIYLDPSCCAGVTPATHEAAIAAMSCCQIQIIESEKTE